MQLAALLEIREIVRPRYTDARTYERVPLVSVQNIFLFDSNYVCIVLGIVTSNCYGCAFVPINQFELVDNIYRTAACSLFKCLECNLPSQKKEEIERCKTTRNNGIALVES